MKQDLFKQTCIATTIALILGGCGGGGSDTTDTTNTNTNSDGETLSSITVGIDIPSQIEAVPASSSSSQGASLRAALGRLSLKANASNVSELDDTSDYAEAEGSLYVEERALEQFDIIEEVFGALEQTNYADPDNVNQGPYKAMIAWEGEENGRDIKQLQEWTVDSRMIVMDLPSDVTRNTTGDVNRLLAWIPERDRDTGEEEMVKAEFLIYSAPETATDGSLIDYGEWDMNVLMDASAEGVDSIPSTGADNFFAASARVNSEGVSTLKVHDKFTEEFEGPMSGSETFSEELRGVLVRDGDDGFGKVSYPDWDVCFQGMGGDMGGDDQGGAIEGDTMGSDPMDNGLMMNPCADGIPLNTAQYAYNDVYMGVQEINDGESADPVYKDRNLDGAIRVVHRYDLFYANADAENGIAEGDNLERHVNFGFPVSYTSTASQDENITFQEHAFYGAWQGRHQLWGPSQITPTTDGTDGTLLTREDVPPNQTAPTYRLKEFDGTLTKRSMISANLSDILDIAVETWIHDHYDLFYKDGTGWEYCAGQINWGEFPATCETRDGQSASFTALAGPDGLYGTEDDSALVAQLSVGENERRHVNAGVCDEQGCTDYMYLASDPETTDFTFDGAGFYAAQWGNRGLSPVTPANKLAGSDGMNMWISMGGSTYVAYVGFENPSLTTTGWVEKTLANFDESTWQPTFEENGDRPFTPERGYEYYMHAKGQNYVVSRTGEEANSADDYRARLELQIAANPVNTTTTTSILPTGTDYLALPWNTDIRLTLIDDPADENYLLLEVVTDSSGTYQAGELYTSDNWGLTAFNSLGEPLDAEGVALTVDEWGWIDPQQNNGREPVQFNFEYVGSDGDSWGKQQFLQTADTNEFVILSDPISLVQVDLYDNLGSATDETVALQYDGWMHGLPDMYNELERNGWSIEGLGDDVRRLLEGQLVTDSANVSYFVKPMDTSLFLGVVTEFPNGEQPDISLADNVDLDSVPDYTHHEMGAAPEGEEVIVKYREGIPVIEE